MRFILLLVFALISMNFVCGDKSISATKKVHRNFYCNLKSEMKQAIPKDCMNYHGCGLPSYDENPFKVTKSKSSQLK